MTLIEEIRRNSGVELNETIHGRLTIRAIKKIQKEVDKMYSKEAASLDSSSSKADKKDLEYFGIFRRRVSEVVIELETLDKKTNSSRGFERRMNKEKFKSLETKYSALISASRHMKKSRKLKILGVLVLTSGISMYIATRIGVDLPNPGGFNAWINMLLVGGGMGALGSSDLKNMQKNEEMDKALVRLVSEELEKKSKGDYKKKSSKLDESVSDKVESSKKRIFRKIRIAVELSRKKRSKKFFAGLYKILKKKGQQEEKIDEALITKADIKMLFWGHNSPEETKSVNKMTKDILRISFKEIKNIDKIEKSVDKLLSLLIKNEYDKQDEKDYKEIQKVFRKNKIKIESVIGGDSDAQGVHQLESKKTVFSVDITKNREIVKSTIIHELTHKKQSELLKKYAPRTWKRLWMRINDKDYHDIAMEVGAFHEEYVYLIEKMEKADKKTKRVLSAFLIEEIFYRDNLKDNILRDYPKNDPVVKFIKRVKVIKI